MDGNITEKLINNNNNNNNWRKLNVNTIEIEPDDADEILENNSLEELRDNFKVWWKEMNETNKEEQTEEGKEEEEDFALLSFSKKMETTNVIAARGSTCWHWKYSLGKHFKILNICERSSTTTSTYSIKTIEKETLF